MTELLTLSSLAAFATLSLLEIVLGIDNLVVISIISAKLPADRQSAARKIGLALAAVGRIALLLGITWVISLESTVLFELPFELGGHVGEAQARAAADATVEAAGRGVTPFSLKDLILVIGGLFLVAKATWEIHHSLEGDAEPGKRRAAAGFGMAVAQILAMDLVFSIDSVLTAVGMVRPEDYSAFWVPITIMIAAVVVAIGVMVLFADPVGNFVARNPTMKMLALAFMLMIGVVLVAEGLHQHIPRGYIYSAMGFSLLVEILNTKAKQSRRAGAPAVS